MAIKIYPYKMGSVGAKALAERLGCKRVFPDKAYHGKGNDLAVNWGASQPPSWGDIPHWANLPYCVGIASNKLHAFEVMEDAEIKIPKYTTNPDEAVTWLKDGMKRIYCRRILNGHSGAGIIVATKPDELVAAPLYVEGITGFRDEYRVHVFDGNIIDTQMKRKKVDAEPNQLIRNHGNGYVYCREDIPPLEVKVRDDIYRAVRSLGLTFGAVDVIVNRERPDNYYILEVNTAPGLEGTTLEVYAEAIERYYDGLTA